MVSDIDALWLRDPTPFFQRHSGADLLVSSDALHTTVGAEEMCERWPQTSEPLNIGEEGCWGSLGGRLEGGLEGVDHGNNTHNNLYILHVTSMPLSNASIPFPTPPCTHTYLYCSDYVAIQ